MIHVLARHCDRENTKARPDWFAKHAAFENLTGTLDDGCTLHVMFDGRPDQHFVVGHSVDIVRFDGGSDAASFRSTLAFAAKQKGHWQDTDIVYFVEDDYMHRPGWPAAIREAFAAGVGDIVSLYDHTDRYGDSLAPCYLKHTQSCHWRSAVSTTNTFAVRFSSLLEDLPVYREFANPEVSRTCVDHEKFVKLLQLKGRRLYTSVPAFSTHCERDFLAPVVRWHEC